MTDVIAKARSAVFRLANTPMQLSLEQWGEISGDILDCIDMAERYHDIEAELNALKESGHG